jgi:hypothetical protein
VKPVSLVLWYWSTREGELGSELFISPVPNESYFVSTHRSVIHYDAHVVKASDEYS